MQLCPANFANKQLKLKLKVRNYANCAIMSDSPKSKRRRKLDDDARYPNKQRSKAILSARRKQAVRMSPPKINVENGFRIVAPYFYTFASYAKGRWLGKTVVDVYSREFIALSAQYIEAAVKLGRLRVNGARISADYKLKDNDFIEHRYHRHEAPIKHVDRVPIVFEDDNVVVVDKPCTWPVHPCGGYYHNSLVQILCHDHPRLTDLRPCHRIDRLTSGLVMIAKNPETDTKIKTQIQSRDVRKIYIARVAGKFPGDTVTRCTVALRPLVRSMGIQRVDLEHKEEEEKEKLSTENGDKKEKRKHAQNPAVGWGLEIAKSCRTEFERLTYCATTDTSIVECRPLTGRTHQLRVHLQYLGHPIVNDLLYNCDAWGDTKGAGGRYEVEGETLSIERLAKRVEEKHSAINWIVDDVSNTKTLPLPDDQGEEELNSIAENDIAWKSDGDSVSDVYCEECQHRRRMPTEEEMKMYLHCLKYTSTDWSYETEMPEWAREK